MISKNVVMIFVWCMAVIGCGIVLSEESSNPGASVTHQLQGRWEIAAGVNQGRTLTEDEIKNTYVTVSLNRIVSFDAEENAVHQAIFSVDDTTKPLSITLTSIPKIAQPDKRTSIPVESTEEISLGIIRIDDTDHWTLCYALPGFNRPTEFHSTKSSKTLLFTLRRKPQAVP